jgi:ABC-type enterochelin transport system permease subunit
MVRRLAVTGVVLAFLAQAAVAQDAAKGGSYWSDAGYGTLAVFANILYMPAKMVYATVGTLTGGLAYLLTVGDTDTANKVLSPSLGGSYVITPAMLEGNEPLLFSGPSYSND